MMAPLSTVQQVQLADLRRKRDLTKDVPFKKRAGDPIREEVDKDDSTVHSNRIRVAQDGRPLVRRDNDNSSTKDDDGILGQLFGHPLFPFGHKSTASLGDQSTTSTAFTTSTTAPAISTTTTAAALPTSTTITALPTPPIVAVTSISTSVNTPPPPPPPPPTTPIVTPAISSTISLSTTPSDVPLALTTILPPTTTMTPFIPLLPSSLDTTSQPRNGLNPNVNPTSTISSSSVTSTTMTSSIHQETVVGSAASAQAQAAGDSRYNASRNASLNPTLQNFLIAAGTIGALIIIVASVYFVLRMRNRDMFYIFRNREICKGESGRYGWRRKRLGSIGDQPSQDLGVDVFPYGSNTFPEDRKPAMQQQFLAGKFSPLIVSKVEVPQTMNSPLLAESQQHDTTQGSSAANPAPFGLYPNPLASHQTTQDMTKGLYTFSSTHINNTYNTNSGALTQNIFSSQDPTSKASNRQSQESSLSSGFGDGQIVIPESPPRLSATRTSQSGNRQVRNFSWVTSIFQAKRREDRDTIYTTASEEQAPRYRTVNSWVAQQTRHIEREQTSDKEIPSMPQVPHPVKSRADSYRNTSESPPSDTGPSQT